MCSRSCLACVLCRPSIFLDHFFRFGGYLPTYIRIPFNGGGAHSLLGFSRIAYYNPRLGRVREVRKRTTHTRTCVDRFMLFGYATGKRLINVQVRRVVPCLVRRDLIQTKRRLKAANAHPDTQERDACLGVDGFVTWAICIVQRLCRVSCIWSTQQGRARMYVCQFPPAELLLPSFSQSQSSKTKSQAEYALQSKSHNCPTNAIKAMSNHMRHTL